MARLRGWFVAGLAISIIVLSVGGGYLAYRSGTLGRLGKGLVRLQGLQWLLGNVDLGWAAPELVAEQWIDAGRALEQEEEYRQAIRAYEKALELAPKETEAYLGLASAYEALGEMDLALKQLQKAGELDPEDGGVHRRLGRLHCLMNEGEACVETLEKAVQLEPEDAQGHYWLALGYQQHAEDGLEEAVAHYQQALWLDPELGIAHLALGTLYGHMPGKEPLAIEEVEKALDVALRAGDEELATKARAELAGLYYGQDRYDECIAEWQQVLESNPDDPVAHRRLGLCYALRREMGDLERAVAEFETALARGFEHMDAYYFYLGQYYATQEDYPRAFLAWDQFLRFSDNEELNAQVRRWIEAYRRALEEGSAP